MARTDRVGSKQNNADWFTTFFMFLGLSVATVTFTGVLVGLAWWLVVVVFVAIMFAIPAIARTVTRRKWIPPAASLVGFLLLLTVFFAPHTGVLWVIPSLETFAEFRTLADEANRSILAQARPADAIQPIVYVMCLGAGAFAIVMDLLALVFRRPAFAGIPLLALILIPSFVDSTVNDPFFFALTAAAYLAILLAAGKQRATKTAAVLGGMAIVGALVVPIALPAVQPAASNNGLSNAVTTGVNPILNLGNDLRRNLPSLALTYSSDSGTGLYLKLSTLEDFTGREWAPTEVDPDENNTVDAFGPPPGVTPAIEATPTVTDIDVGNILGRWLPVPYPATSITGLSGDWYWEPEGLAVRSTNSNMRGQSYQVESNRLRPNSDQLVGAGTRVEPGMERYLAVPDELPAIVAETAAEVVGAATNNFDKAIALQNYFTGPEFEYSESAPVEQGYDGSGAQILGEFLVAKAGYCIHYSSAMAAMARTLGIPSRVVVGFTPGVPELDEAGLVIPDEAGLTVEYTVTTDDLHAWPELYFAGVGWVQFEPTPGRGFTPDFRPPPVDDPETPDIDESTQTPTPTSNATGPPTGLPQETETNTAAPGGPGAAASAFPWWLTIGGGLVAVVLIPLAARAFQRYSRFLSLTRGGSVVAAWDEIRGTARDLGLDSWDTDTPRMLAAGWQGSLAPEDAAALGRVLHAVESEAFADLDAEVHVGDVRAVSAGLRRSVDVGTRLRATFLPVSLFATWLSSPARLSDAPSAGA